MEIYNIFVSSLASYHRHLLLYPIFFIFLSLCLYLITNSSLFSGIKETFLGLTLLSYPHSEPFPVALSQSTTRLLESGLISVTPHPSSPQLCFGFCPHHSMKLFGQKSQKIASLPTLPPSYLLSFHTDNHGEEFFMLFQRYSIHIQQNILKHLPSLHIDTLLYTLFCAYLFKHTMYLGNLSI